MKKLLRIARIELNILFYSPIAWLMIILFMVLAAMTFMDKLADVVQLQEMGRSLLPSRHQFTLNIFANSAGQPPFFPGITDMLYWFMPLLTMGLMSRETSSGTIKLLFSSPLSVKDIVLGKFLAIMAFNLILLLVMSFFVCIGMVVLQSADGGLLFSGLLGCFLLLCTYSSIGLFMSCLTSYQVAAALMTFCVFAFLSYVGGIWQYIDLVRDLTYFLSINSRASNLFLGMITSKDVLYFIIITLLFLSFAMFKLQAGRESSSFVKRTGRYALAFTIALTLGYFSGLPRFIGYADMTANHMNTLSKGMQQALVHEFDGETLVINSFINIIETQTAEAGMPQQRKRDEQRWSLYTRFKPDIKFTYTYFYDSVPDDKFYGKFPGKTLREIAEQAAETFNLDMDKVLSPEQIHQKVAMPLELGRYCIQLQYKDRTTFLRLSDIDEYRFPLEPEISAGLKRLKATKMPKYCFLQGEYERTPYKGGEKNFSDMNKVWLRYALVNQGYDMDTLDLHTRNIPSDMTGLVIADPRVAFDTLVRGKIQRYIDDGGNLVIMGETGKQNIINPFIRQFGVHMKDGMIMQKTENYSRDLVMPLLHKDAAAMYPVLESPFSDSLPVVMPGATGLIYAQGGAYTVRPLVKTDSATSWQRSTIPVLDSAAVEFMPGNGDERGPWSTAVTCTRKVGDREQRIMITGDADWLANMTIGFPRKHYIRNANNELSLAIFGWMTNGVFPIDLTKTQDKDRWTYVTGAQIPYLRVALTWVLPGIVLVAAIVLLVRRKRK